ncbi:MAG: hydrolase [Alphaproteobacteria bacterium]|nr:hydrolase [Alphaproteobacteria bacterium]
MPDVSRDEAAVLDAAAAAPMLAQVEAWAAVNSGSRNLDGLARMAGLLADAFAVLPGEVRLVEPAAVEEMAADGSLSAVAHGRNLHLKVRPEAPVQVLLTGHMDTVYGADHPFQALDWLDEGTLRGPGVADMKGGLTVMLAALGAVETWSERGRIGYEIVINSDEEVGSPGSAALIAAAARGKRAALTYEPAALPDGTLAGARPGSGNFSLRVAGRSAHAGRNPEEGRNALVAAAELAVRLDAFGRRSGLRINPARIDGGGPNNVVPDHAILRMNMRPATADEQAQAQAALEEAVAAVAAARDVCINMHGGFGRPPKPIDAGAEKLFELVRTCGAALGQEIGWRDSGGVCDGNNIAAGGTPVVDTMGVRGGAIHSPDEYLIVASLAERARLSALVLMRLAAGEGS